MAKQRKKGWYFPVPVPSQVINFRTPTLSAGQTDYYPLNCVTTDSNSYSADPTDKESEDAAPEQVMVFAQAGTLRLMRLDTRSAIAADQSVTVTIVCNGVESDIVIVLGEDDTEGDDTTHELKIPARAWVAIKAVSVGAGCQFSGSIVFYPDPE